ncbi:MAG TPA: hypothetical protein VN105_08950, partial [Chitinophaga sp.]|nr:hypothetical protein [Chitinophaga sp.]
MIKRYFSGILLLSLFITQITFAQSANHLPDWALGGFVRPAGKNPIIAPDTTTLFTDPMSKSE